MLTVFDWLVNLRMMCSQLVCVFEKNEQDVIVVYLFGISVDVNVFFE